MISSQFHFFVLGFSFLMAIYFLVKSIINKWDRSYLLSFLMFLTTIISLTLWEKLISWTASTGTRFNPGLVGLWLNQLTPIILILLYREFLGSKTSNPKLYHLLSVMAILLFIFNTGVFISKDYSFLATIPFIKVYEWSLFLSFVIFAVIFIRYIKDSLLQYVFWSALAVVLTFGGYLTLHSLEIKTIFFPWFENNFLIFLGIIMDGLLFLTALSLREKDVIDKRNQIEIEKNELLVNQNENLEAEVNIRTTELNESLAQLKDTQSQLIEFEKAAATLRVKHAISHDLHDEVGSTLTSIQLLSKVSDTKNIDPQNAGLLQKINEQTRLLQSRIRDIVWSNQAEQFNINSLYAKLKEIAIQLLEPANLEIDIKRLPESIDKISLSSFRSKNILMIFREALNNIVKHAQANTVTIYWEKQENQISLHIKDDGNGKMDIETQGSGLRIMQSRAEEIGASILFFSSHAGSHIILNLNSKSVVVL